MNFWKTYVSAAVSLAFATAAFSQDALSRASFTLPYATHWNAELLQPGEYELSIPASANWPQTIKVSKEGQTICLLPAVESSIAVSEGNELRLKKVGNEAVVTDLSLGGMSKSFHFVIPKSVKRQQARSEERASTKTVALVSAAK